MDKFIYKLAANITKVGCVCNVSYGDKIGQVFRNIDESVTKHTKWCLADLTGLEITPESQDVEVQYFPSRRAAFHFFKTGEKFEIKPVYASRGKLQRRIR